MATNISIPLLKKTSTTFTDESRIQAEGQKDGEKNIPQMGSYVTAQFEQALIAHGEQAVQRIYEKASQRIAHLQPVFQACLKRVEELEIRLKPIAEAYEARKKELGRDVSILFPSILHLVLIVFLAIGEFPLNTVVFRLFGEAEYLTYVMASTLAVTIPLLGLFIGIHMRHSIPPLAGNILIGILSKGRGRQQATVPHVGLTIQGDSLVSEGSNLFDLAFRLFDFSVHFGADPE